MNGAWPRIGSSASGSCGTRTGVIAIAADSPSSQRADAGADASPEERRGACAYRRQELLTIVMCDGVGQAEADAEAGNGAGDYGMSFDPRTPALVR